MCEVSRWVRYAYFLRFSLLLWIFPLVLVWANSPTAARSFVSGILTPTLSVQYLCVSFFLLSDSVVSLILARIVVIHGRERFGEEPPQALVWLLAHPDGRYEWVALVLSLLNSARVFWYFRQNGASEMVDIGQMTSGMLWGSLLAFFFWYGLSAFYYLTYQPSTGAKGARGFGAGAARTLIFPRAWMFLSDVNGAGRFGDVLEDAETPFHFGIVLSWLPVAGYRASADAEIYEGHYLALVSAGGFFMLFWALWPLTSPVPTGWPAMLALVLYVLCAVVVYSLVLSARNPAQATQLRWWKAILAIPVLGYAIAIPLLYERCDGARFPILALVLIMVISTMWTMGAIAFFADRYRVPVASLLILSIFLPRFFHWDGGREEHYLSISAQKPNGPLPSPAEIVNERLAAFVYNTHDETPYLVVVTSTGGGIHAAAWTTEVLRQLEGNFQTSHAGAFHDHVVLLSTVSGGSAGLYAYLREIDQATNGGQPDWDRMTRGAKCSSLEAIGWGLVYFDVPRLMVPLGYMWTSSDGVADLAQSPFGKDRTWALRKALARNLNDPFCALAPLAKNTVALDDVANAQAHSEHDEEALTLGNMLPLSARFPAFTMNTTVTEVGARFLLSNYQVPPPQTPLAYAPAPAESFLSVYGSAAVPQLGKDHHVDLPLATAAQLSATFPYVSSAARFPFVDGMQSVHFVDGGYYDNDGTASAIEFLRAALDGLSPGLKKLRIVLVEIRNSPDPDPPKPGNGPTTPAAWQAWRPTSNAGDALWNAGNQATAPLLAFYGAGHESVTARNRNSLLLLEKAYADKLELRHIVIDDQCARTTGHTDPLNWSLTPKQQTEVTQTASLPTYQARFAAVAGCFTGSCSIDEKTPVIDTTQCVSDASGK
jgi:hypothetical protein